MILRRTLAAALGLLAVAAFPPLVLAHGPVPAEPPTLGNLLLAWTWEPAIMLPLVLTAVLWWRMLAAIDRAHPATRVPASRRWSFLAGLLAIAFALASGIDRYDTTLFSIHMVQHLLLIFVAPPLLAAGAPITQLLRVSSPRTRSRWILPVLHSRPVSFLGHPIIAWLAFTTILWVSHFSPLFETALENQLVHDLEHVLYLAAGLLFWWPVIGLDPAPHRMSFPARIMYLLLQVPQNSFLSMAILFADTPLYRHYATLGSPYGIDALDDQRLAAGIMWFAGDVLFIGALLGALAAWMRAEQRGEAGSERRAATERAAIEERAAALARRRGAQSGSGEASSVR